ncbi:hypothetical protein BDC45DRAFT_173734 [Circinella umbellata]|nr:hypothetical protein BDC45DRAFT_173734 [Circinella umbellata]
MIIRKEDINSTVDIVHKNNNYCRVIQLNDLFTVLPYEVLCAIFSHLSWGDLVLCMSIHPTWASYIPLYAKNKLSTFEFQSDTLQFQQCWMGLGPHVENVIMHQLIDADCVNKALEILLEQKCYTIKKLSEY